MSGLFNNSFVVFDLETTGLYPEKGARICEIGAAKYQEGKEVDRYQTFVNPQMSMPPEASAVNGIYDFDLVGAPKLSEVIDDFLYFIGNGPLFGYKISFDLGFMNNELSSLKRKELSNKAFDVLFMARHCLKELKRYSLVDVATYFDIDKGVSHRAYDDAKTTALVFKALCPLIEEDKVLTFDALYDLCGYNKETNTKIDDVLYEEIKHAIKTQGMLRIKYKSAKGDLTDREIMPLRIERRGKDFFLIAQCVLRNDMRSFSINRIASCERVM